MLLASIRVGISMIEFDQLEIGEILDIIITFNNNMEANKNHKSSNVRNATQDDFDRF